MRADGGCRRLYPIQPTGKIKGVLPPPPSYTSLAKPSARHWSNIMIISSQNRNLLNSIDIDMTNLLWLILLLFYRILNFENKDLMNSGAGLYLRLSETFSSLPFHSKLWCTFETRISISIMVIITGWIKNKNNNNDNIQNSALLLRLRF